jgi:hypothetical protein
MENRKSIFETRIFKVLLAAAISAVVYVLMVLIIDYLFVKDRELELWQRLITCVIIASVSVLSDKNISIKRVIFIASGCAILFALVNVYFS